MTLAEYIAKSHFTLYSSYGQPEYSTLIQPQRSIILDGDPFTQSEEKGKSFGNASKLHKQMAKKPLVSDQQPKSEIFRKRHIE